MESTFLQKFRENIRRKNLFSKGETLVVGISGGLDSVVLGHVLKQMEVSQVWAHVNYKLRESESDRDELFVRDLAEKWGIQLDVAVLPAATYAADYKMNLQEAARKLRYSFFEKCRVQQLQFTNRVKIATAHHANDAIETMLMHLFRGTGIEGLKGIPETNQHVIRPLLWAGRKEIEEYARQHSLQWVEDSSNKKDYYSRNFIRNKLMPLIDTQFPGAQSGMLSTMEKLQQAGDLYRQQVQSVLIKLVKNEGEVQKIPVEKLRKTRPFETIVWEWIKPLDFSEGQIEEVAKLLDAETGRRIESSTHRILKNRNWLIAHKLGMPEKGMKLFDTFSERQVIDENRALVLETRDFTMQKNSIKLGNPETEMVDIEKIKLPLILRPIRSGDYFYPLGMPKKKKVSRLLIDLKVSMHDKENVWVLESDRKIIWVIGYRIDDRYKITANTKKVLMMKIQSTPNE